VNKIDFTRVLTQNEDILNGMATTPTTEESKEAQINKVHDDISGEGTVHDTREEEDECPTCNHRVAENETAVACDGIFQRWHHLSCAELRGQFNPLNPELNPICYLLSLLGAHNFHHVSRIRAKLLTFRLLMSYIQGVTGGRDKTSGECSLR